jgi:hypothetical protein
MKIKIKNLSTGITFLARIVKEGDRYGQKMCLTHDKADQPLIEFYDTRYAFHADPAGEMLGQFVSRYSVATLQQDIERLEANGLCLHGGESDWNLDGRTMQIVAGFMDANT